MFLNFEIQNLDGIMANRRSKTENKYGTYRDIPKKYSCKKIKPRKKYVFIHDGKHYNIVAYSCTNIADHFNIKRDIVQRGIIVVDKFNNDTILNLCKTV